AWEVRGRGAPRDIDVARRRHDREGVGRIVTASAQERRLLEAGEILDQPCDERVAGAAQPALWAGSRAGEVEGERLSGDVDVTRWSDREGGRVVEVAPAERRRLEQRVDHDRPA